MPSDRSQRWQRIITRTAADYQNLPPSGKCWISERLTQIDQLQTRLYLLFEGAGGLQSCAGCRGDCCARGHNHMTLANLLGYLQQGLLPPAADFSRTCPFLCDEGCLLPMTRRPYNCISFVCDIIEICLTSSERDQFYSLEQRLRGVYQEFSERYVGGGSSGLLLQEERLAGRSFLALKPEAGVSSLSGQQESK